MSMRTITAVAFVPALFLLVSAPADAATDHRHTGLCGGYSASPQVVRQFTSDASGAALPGCGRIVLAFRAQTLPLRSLGGHQYA